MLLVKHFLLLDSEHCIWSHMFPAAFWFFEDICMMLLRIELNGVWFSQFKMQKSQRSYIPHGIRLREAKSSCIMGKATSSLTFAYLDSPYLPEDSIYDWRHKCLLTSLCTYGPRLWSLWHKIGRLKYQVDSRA